MAEPTHRCTRSRSAPGRGGGRTLVPRILAAQARRQVHIGNVQATRQIETNSANVAAGPPACTVLHCWASTVSLGRVPKRSNWPRGSERDGTGSVGRDCDSSQQWRWRRRKGGAPPPPTITIVTPSQRQTIDRGTTPRLTYIGRLQRPVRREVESKLKSSHVKEDGTRDQSYTQEGCAARSRQGSVARK